MNDSIIQSINQSFPVEYYIVLSSNVMDIVDSGLGCTVSTTIAFLSCRLALLTDCSSFCGDASRTRTRNDLSDDGQSGEGWWSTSIFSMHRNTCGQMITNHYISSSA